MIFIYLILEIILLGCDLIRTYIKFGRVKSAEAASPLREDSFKTSAMTLVQSNKHLSFSIGEFF